MYIDQDNVPFYVGKGSGKRFYISKHLYSNQPFLERKIKKVGVNNIKTHFLHENLVEEEAFSWEKYWIKYLGRRNNGTGQLCNITDGGEGVSGHTHSEETKKKISKSLVGNQHAKGFVQSEEHKRKISEATKGENNPMYNRKHSEEAKKKMSESTKGENNPMYNRKGINHPMYGKHHSEKAKKKMSEDRMGNQYAKGFIHSEETRKKLSVAKKGKNHPMYGKHHSEKTKMKMSNAMKLYWAEKNERK